MTQKIEIFLNGEKKIIPTNWAIGDLLDHLGLERRQVAIELNREIVKRKRWSEKQFGVGDQVEIVHFVGGG